MDACVFCKIVAGDIPSHKIYEDAKTLAFLGIKPPVEGFTLIVPKLHSNQLWDMSEEDYSYLLHVAKHIARQIERVYQPSRVGLQVEGLEVAHTHLKLLPINSADDFRAPEPADPMNDQTLAVVAEKLKISDIE